MTNLPLNIQRQEQKRSDLDEQIREYIAEWRKQRAKEEEELKRLKVRSFVICALLFQFHRDSLDTLFEEYIAFQEKQAKRKVTRADEEKRLAQKKREEEERRQREMGKGAHLSLLSFR